MSSNSDDKKNSPSSRPTSRLQIRLPSKSNVNGNNDGNENVSDAVNPAVTNPPLPAQQQQQQQQQQQEAKPWPVYKSNKPIPPSASTGTGTGANTTPTQTPAFSRTDQVHLHHQSTNLHFIYNHINHKWSYSGETTMYLSHVQSQDHNTNTNTNGGAGANAGGSSNTHVREIAFHVRGGSKMQIHRATVILPLPNTNTNSNTNTQTKSSSATTDNTTTSKTNQRRSAVLTPMRAELIHHDPLAKILTKPANTFTPKEFYIQSKNKRYEADTQCNRGGQGMMDAMRCASVASYFGEGRARFICPSVRVATEEELRSLWRKDLDVDSSYSSINSSMNSSDFDLNVGSLQGEIQGMDYERGGKRREERLNLIADLMVQEQIVWKNDMSASAKKASTTGSGSAAAAAAGSAAATSTASSVTTAGLAQGLKLVIHFQMQDLDSIAHLGGIHFHAPKILSNANATAHASGNTTATTPHVYTTCGITGDHQGTRSWVPTIDSASSKDRATHELTVRVTADSREGLWAAGCGEHYGVCKTVLHSVPREVLRGSTDVAVATAAASSLENTSSLVAVTEKQDSDDDDDRLEEEMEKVLGKKCVDYMTKTFKGSLLLKKKEEEGDGNMNGGGSKGNKVHVIPLENGAVAADSLPLRTQLATSTWMTSVWSPCPARSLGFAIGPFDVMYDPEYYGKDGNDNDDDEDDDEDDEDEGEEEEDEYPTISETAEKNGEGIRQLCFALKDERPYIHANAIIIGMEGVRGIHKVSSSVLDSELKKQIVISITGSTAGVPNRALSLMRDILSLPSYRTMSYTQIWIPGAVDGGVSSGTLHACPEISCNPFLGGAILDAKLLHPVGYRLPFHAGGKVLQFAQARCAVRGWITSALPLGGSDDIGHSYIHTLIEKFIMSLYERAHGAYGEGGSRHGFYFSKRFAASSGLNSKNMDFLPVTNVEEEDMAYVPAMGAVGSLPVDERGTEQLWRNANNGTESHTVTLDEFLVNHLLAKDVLEGIERMDKDSLPSMGWLGSHLSATFLTSNSTSSSRIGCGAVELLHPVGGAVYRDLKCRSLAKVIEARAGITNFVRVVRAAFVAAILEDKGVKQVDLPQENPKKKRDGQESKKREGDTYERQKPLFILCVDELLRKGGIAHGSFTRSLRALSGPIRDPYLRGGLVDVTRKSRGLIPAQPEGFPNSFVRGSCGLYLRVGVHVEAASAGDQQLKNNNLQAHILAEPVIPDGGIAFGGPITLRIIERGGQCREFVRVIESEGSRSDWGPITLYGDSVTTSKKQLAASGAIEAGHNSKKSSRIGKEEESKDASHAKKSLLGTSSMSNYPAFDDSLLHRGGYQALELVRLANRTPLLWVRVDPHGIFDGRIALFQQDACLGEQLFHDGDASSQVEALRALAERPLRVQGSVKVKSLFGVMVEDLPVHLLADCLRGSVALHADLPHNPAIRSQAAFAIAQWQNNKAPLTQNSVGWVGLHLLVQYFNEQFYKNGNVVSPKFSRICLRADTGADANNANNQTSTDSGEYQYLDMFTSEHARLNAIAIAKTVEREEDEEYRVRCAVVTAIACVRAKDGTTPPLVLEVLQKILETDNETRPISVESLEEERLMRSKRRRRNIDDPHNDHHEVLEQEEQWFEDIDNIPYASSSLVADALLALCYINARPEVNEDPATGKRFQSKANHPCLPLMELCKKWLEWDLYKEDISTEAQVQHMTPIGMSSVIAPCAITALYSLALLRQSTTDSSVDGNMADSEGSQKRKHADVMNLIDSASDCNFYVDIFDSSPPRSDATRAAAAQAILSLCCASDKNDASEAVGLLTGLEFVMKRMLEPTASPGLRQTLAALMLDACTGKICSSQRVAAITKCNTISDSGNLLFNGPLGASYGSENGASIHTFVAEHTMPAANAVNNGARRGLKLLKQAGKSGHAVTEITLVRVAKLATDLWRTVNGELGGIGSKDNVAGVTPITSAVDGICAHDGILRCSLLSLWQWLWGGKECIAVLRVQSWKKVEGTTRYKALGADEVMKIEDCEKEAALAEEKSCDDLRNITLSEVDRQGWRGEMAKVRREEVAATKDPSANAQGVNYPLHVIEKNDAWKHGGWVACAHGQRRTKNADGGFSGSVTKLRLTVKGND